MTETRYATIAQTGDVMTLKINVAELRDAQLVYAVRDELVAAVTSAATKHVIVDCREITFLGSVGLLALLSLRRIPSVERIVVCNMSPILRGVMFTSRLAGEDASRDYPFEYAADDGAAAARLAPAMPANS